MSLIRTQWIGRLSSIAGVILFFTLQLHPLSASDINDLKLQLQEKEQAITELEEEIKQYQKDIEESSAAASNLKTEVSRLNATIKKLRTDIAITQRRIEFAELLVEKLGIEIQTKEGQIQRDKNLLAEFIREINEASNQSLVEILLANASFADFFDSLHSLDTLQNATHQKLNELRSIKQEQEKEKQSREIERSNLALLAEELRDRNSIEKSAHDDKSYLLKVTKQREDEYRRLLAEQLKKKEALEKEIQSIEDQIRVAIDPASLPESRSGVLGPPLDDIATVLCSKDTQSKNCVTQFFGNTDFATQNPQIYNGKGHNGIDFRATTGSVLYASESGIVRAVGDTDQQCRGVSYGKWILIEHPNNLSTLYAHLSNISVSQGQEVKRGDRIGYTGSTGYSTGPHLHFTVFATQAVRITSLNPDDPYYYKSKICGTPLYLPISPQNGYLNPLSYL